MHDDYIEQFLFDTKTRLKNYIDLYINYESLQGVTHNFTTDATRVNCAKIIQLHLDGLIKRDKYADTCLKEYFSCAKIHHPL